MNEYELSDLLNGMISNVIQGQVLFITALTAYLVVAYTVGAKLTRYQVSFINLMFLLLMFNGLNGQIGTMNMVFEWAIQIAELKGDNPVAMNSATVSKGIMFGTRILLTTGALVFMWQVRHPKTE